MNIDEIRRIAEIMQKHDLTEFSIESEDCKMKVRRGQKEKNVSPSVSPPVFPSSYPTSQPDVFANNSSSGPDVEAAADSDRESPVTNTIDSPIVGTFYSAPAPDAESFVKPGDVVTSDTVVCIIEAMKVMNEIKAEKSGKIKRVLVENTQPVEFGQPLFELE